MSRNSLGGDETIFAQTSADDAPVTFLSWLVNILVKTSMKRSGVITLNSCGVAYHL